MYKRGMQHVPRLQKNKKMYALMKLMFSIMFIMLTNILIMFSNMFVKLSNMVGYKKKIIPNFSFFLRCLEKIIYKIYR